MIVPGSANPLLMAGGTDPLDEFGVIARSLRFRSSAGATMRRTMAATGNRQTLVAVAWVKRAGLASAAALFAAPVVVGNSEHQMRFEPTGEITFYDGSASGALLKTSGVYRDPAEFMQVIFAIDTTQAVQANRGFIIVNGAAAPLQTSVFTLNQNIAFNLSGNPEGVGCLASLSGTSIDGYVGWAAKIDGYPTGINSGNWSAANIAALFGVKHPVTGEWRPKTRAALKALVDAGGPCSFFLPFDDPTTTTTLAADASSKGNNFTAANISLTTGTTYDSMLDSPTNCFATLNPLNNLTIGGSSPSVATEGNLGVTDSGVSTGSFIPSTIAVSTGKIYAESVVTLAGTANVNFGLMPASLSRVWASANSVYAGIYGSGTSGIFVNGALAQTLSNWSSGDVCSMAVDLVASSIQFYRNGAAYGTAVSITSNLAYVIAGFATRDGSGFSSRQYLNFGQQPWDSRTASLRTSLFAAGFVPLSTKNLPKPTNSAAINPTTAFVAVTDTGANVQTTLAAARSGWPSYIEIFKRRDAVEGWRWRFSDDVANYLDSSSTAAKAAFPALTAGGSYSGYALRVGAANGVAMGVLTHTNGVADTVTDGLGNVRKLILLKSESTGAWFLYHPDLTAGRLLYLNQTSAETADTTLSNVLSNSFQVAAALASGTYRWVALSEQNGFVAFGRYTGNNSADGPFKHTMLSAAMLSIKRVDDIGDHWAFDNARQAYNTIGPNAYFNSTAADNTQTTLDFVSNGFKLRLAGNQPNGGGTYVYWGFAAFPFRYANAR